MQRLFLRGGFPRSFLARTNAESMAWRRQFIETFLQRDLPQLGIQTPAVTLRRFWTMLAHYHGQIWNGSELARSLGVSQPTVRTYLGLLEATFVVRRLQPWHENLKKRQVKAPKLYLEDTGLLHCLLNLPTQFDLDGHPKVGASWESFAMGAVVSRLGARWDECYFWATHQGAELDLLVVRGRKRLAFEFKRTTAPRTTSSMRIAMDDLGLPSLRVVHLGDHTFPMAEKITAVAFRDLEANLRPLR